MQNRFIHPFRSWLLLLGFAAVQPLNATANDLSSLDDLIEQRSLFRAKTLAGELLEHALQEQPPDSEPVFEVLKRVMRVAALT